MNDVLLIIDMQNAYKTGQPWGCPNIHSVISNIQKLLSSRTYRAVYFTRHLPGTSPAGTWKQYNEHYDQINDTPELSEIVTELKPFAKMHSVLDKSSYSAVPALPQELFTEPMPRIAVTGVVAQCCVLSTVLGLVDRGIEILYLKDAVTAQHPNLVQMTETIVDSFSPIHTKIISTDKYLSPD